MSVHKDRNKTWYVKYQNITKRGFNNKRDALIYEASIRLQEENGSSTHRIYKVIDEYLAYNFIIDFKQAYLFIINLVYRILYSILYRILFF